MLQFVKWYCKYHRARFIQVSWNNNPLVNSDLILIYFIVIFDTKELYTSSKIKSSKKLIRLFKNLKDPKNAANVYMHVHVVNVVIFWGILKKTLLYKI